MDKEQLAKFIAEKFDEALKASDHPKKFFITANGRGVKNFARRIEIIAGRRDDFGVGEVGGSSSGFGTRRQKNFGPKPAKSTEKAEKSEKLAKGKK